MNPCDKCLMPSKIKCCHNCKKDAAKCGNWHKCGVDCEKWEAPIQTNADRIRAMNDEELVNIVPCPLGFSMFRCTKNQKCKDCKKEWLKEPAEVEE